MLAHAWTIRVHHEAHHSTLKHLEVRSDHQASRLLASILTRLTTKALPRGGAPPSHRPWGQSPPRHTPHLLHQLCVFLALSFRISIDEKTHHLSLADMLCPCIHLTLVPSGQSPHMYTPNAHTNMKPSGAPGRHPRPELPMVRAIEGAAQEHKKCESLS